MAINVTLKTGVSDEIEVATARLEKTTFEMKARMAELPLR